METRKLAALACVTAFCAVLVGLSAPAFSTDYGSGPHGALVFESGSSTTMWGTCTANGTSSLGTIYTCTTAGVLANKHNFTGWGSHTATHDGSVPRGALIDIGDGYVYGTCSTGGSKDYSTPCGPMCTTWHAYDYGTIFKMNKSTGVYSWQYNLDNSQATASLREGGNPGGALFAYSYTIPGNMNPTTFLYGTCMSGGANGTGTIFKIDTAGNFTKLADFGTGQDGGTEATLIKITDSGTDYLYGTRPHYLWGVSGSCFNTPPDSHNGDVFRFNPQATSLPLTPTPVAWTVDCYMHDGGIPTPQIVSDGTTIYGTSQGGDNIGSVWSAPLSGNAEVVTPYLFSNVSPYYGAFPHAGMAYGPQVTATLYGTTYNTYESGSQGLGSSTLFKWVPGNSPSYKVHSFGGTLGDSVESPMISDGSQYMYGTAMASGAGSKGTVYKVDTSNDNLSLVVAF